VIERFFRDLTDKRLRRGAFRSVPELEKTILSNVCRDLLKPKWVPGERETPLGYRQDRL